MQSIKQYSQNGCHHDETSVKTPLHRNDLAHAVQRALRQPTVCKLRAGLLCVVLAGAVPYVTADVFPAEFELSSLATGDGSAGFVLNGIDETDFSGGSVSAAGDINGDGIGDLIIGATGARNYDGESYVVFGRDTGFPAEFELSSLATGNGSIGFVVNGISGQSGNSVSAAGDIIGDGIDDLIIAASFANPGGINAAGESYVVFGRDTGFPAEFELSSLASGNGENGFIAKGIDELDRSGYSVSAAGDINGDGMGDLIIGALLADPGGRNRAGESYVVLGRDNGFPAEFELLSLATGDGVTGFVVNGAETDDFSGGSVSCAGDINGDGVDDLIIGANEGGGMSVRTGKSHVVFGRVTGFPAEFELSSLASGDGSTGFVLNGIDTGDSSGRSVSAAEDINGDGLDDLIISANFADPGGRYNVGESYVVFGRDTGFPAEFELSSLVSGGGGTGFVLNGIDESDQSGNSVSAAGDINGDGIDDLIISALFADPVGQNAAGESYVVFGRDTGFPAEFELSSLALGDGGNGFVINGINESLSGAEVSAAGDINADGIDDLIVGAPLANPGGRYSAGESYVVFGRAADSDDDGVNDINDNCTLVANADQRDTNGDGYGNFCDPDLNNDGVVNFADLALWVPLFNTANQGDADFDGDGFVNFSDYALFPQYFLQAPGPSGVATLQTHPTSKR